MKESVKNSHRFFSNRECKYFPCHAAPPSAGGSSPANTGDFNCLFCYCPLYLLGNKCGGNFKYSGPKKIKNCEDCHLPHLPEYYDTIISKLKEAMNETPL